MGYALAALPISPLSTGANASSGSPHDALHSSSRGRPDVVAAFPYLLIETWSGAVKN